MIWSGPLVTVLRIRSDVGGHVCDEERRVNYFGFSGLVCLHHAMLRQVAVLLLSFLVLLRQYRPRQTQYELFAGLFFSC